MKHLLLRRLCIFTALLMPAAASADINLRFNADEPASGSRSIGARFAPPADRAWGRVAAGDGGTSAALEVGRPPCSQLDCFGSIGSGASAAMWADTTTMSFGARSTLASTAAAYSDARAHIEVSDVLVHEGPTLLNVHVHAELGVESQGADAYASFAFFVSGSSESYLPPERLFYLGAEHKNGAAGFSVGAGEDSFYLPNVPPVIDYWFTLALPAGESYYLSIDVRTWAYGSEGSAAVKPLNTVQLGITGDYTSANGYSYTGYTPAVPEPTSAALMLAFFLCVFVLRAACPRDGVDGLKFLRCLGPSGNTRHLTIRMA